MRFQWLVTERCSIISSKLISHLWMKSFGHPFVYIFPCFVAFFFPLSSLVLKYCYTWQVFHLSLSSDPKMLREVVSQTINCGPKFHAAQFSFDDSRYVDEFVAFAILSNVPIVPGIFHSIYMDYWVISPRSS